MAVKERMHAINSFSFTKNDCQDLDCYQSEYSLNRELNIVTNLNSVDLPSSRLFIVTLMETRFRPQ